MLVINRYIILGLSVLYSCTTLHRQAKSQFETVHLPSDVHNVDSLSYIVVYKAWISGHKFRLHPPSKMYFILNKNIEISNLRCDLEIVRTEDLSIIPKYMTMDSMGYVLGNQAFAPDILGCCEYGDIQKGVRQYVIEKKKDDLLMKYEKISLFNKNLIKYLMKKSPNIKLKKRNVIVELYIAKMKTNYCVCKSYGYENIGYLTSNDYIAYVAENQFIQELSSEEIAVWENLFERLLIQSK